MIAVSRTSTKSRPFVVSGSARGCSSLRTGHDIDIDVVIVLGKCRRERTRPFGKRPQWLSTATHGLAFASSRRHLQALEPSGKPKLLARVLWSIEGVTLLRMRMATIKHSTRVSGISRRSLPTQALAARVLNHRGRRSVRQPRHPQGTVDPCPVS